MQRWKCRDCALFIRGAVWRLKKSKLCWIMYNHLHSLHFRGVCTLLDDSYKSVTTLTGWKNCWTKAERSVYAEVAKQAQKWLRVIFVTNFKQEFNLKSICTRTKSSVRLSVILEGITPESKIIERCNKIENRGFVTFVMTVILETSAMACLSVINKMRLRDSRCRLLNGQWYFAAA